MNDSTGSHSQKVESGAAASENADIDQIKADIQKLRNDIAALSTNTAEQSKAKLNAIADELMQEGRRVMDDVHQRGTDAFNSAQQAGKEGYDQIEQHIKEKPFIAILIALGLGLLVGKLLSRD